MTQNLSSSAQLLAQFNAGKLATDSASTKLPAGEYRHQGDTGRIGKAKMIIGADGTGIYVNGRSEAIELTVKEAATRAAYLNYFVPGSAPVETPATTVVPTPRAKALAAKV